MPSHVVVYSGIKAHYGGMEYALLHLIQALSPAYRFTVMTQASPDFRAKLEALGAAWLETPVPAAFSPRQIRAIARQFGELNADLIYTIDPRGSTVGCPAAKLARLPVVHRHGISPLDYQHTGRAKWLVYAAGEAALFWLAADVVVFNAHNMYTKYRRLGLTPPHKTRYIPNGVDIAAMQALAAQRENWRTHYGIPPQTFAWVHPSRLDYQKAPEIILAAAQLLPKDLDWKLILAGDAPPDLIQLADSLGERVAFLGRLSQPESHQLLAAGDGLLYPSRFENMPNTVLEALSLNTPAIVTDVGDSWYLVGKGALPPAGECIACEDASQLSQAMLHWMQDTADYQALKAACPARVLPFERQTLLSQWQALFGQFC